MSGDPVRRCYSRVGLRKVAIPMKMDVQLAEHSVTMNKERFQRLWQRCDQAADAETVNRVFRLLQDHYSESWRRYHTGDHLKHCLKYLDLASHLMENPDAVEMALWFHDVIYDARACDNEKRSAELFLRLSEGHLDELFRQRVHDLIMITEHFEPPAAGDERFIVDIDLSGFGLPWEEFERDSRNVRAEFPHLDDDEYNRRQLKFLQRLMARPTFYASSFFRERYESTARENIAHRLEDMARQGYGDASA